MKKHLLAGLAVVLVVGISASAAMAQCAFEHPKKANKFSSTFVQAFVSCNNAGGNASNTTTEGGVMSCKPPETFNQQAGTPVDGWQWDELKGQGQVQFKSAKLAKPPITPADSSDLKVKAKLKGVVDALGGAASGTGGLATVARATFNDRMNGDLTVIDFPATFAFTLADGKGQVKTTADALLNGISQPGLPHCTSIEVVSIMVLDKNGNAFANVGTFNP
jgi:putative hemolysin